MTRKILSGLAACFTLASGAQAQNAQIYGILDTGVEYLNNVGPSGSSLVRMPTLSGGQLPSRVGFRGSEDLGNGLKATFLLEMGIGLDTGASLQSGRLFGRQAFVGLSGGWGTLTLGRHWTMTFFSLLDADVMGPATFGLAGFDSYLPAARVDNSISYRGTFSGFTLGGTYSLGRDTLAPGNCAGEVPGGGCKEWSLLVKYDSSNWGVALAHDRLDGGPTGTFTGQPPGTVPNLANADKRTILDGYYKFRDTKLGVGWVKRELRANPQNLSTDIYFVGMSQPFGAFGIDGQVLALRNEAADANSRMLVVRGNYALSKRTSLWAMAAHVDNDRLAAYSVSAGGLQPSLPAVGTNQTGFMVGLRHSF